jgi:1-phosphofructokinase
MIVTLTPNPSLDRTVRVGRVQLGSLNRIDGAADEPSGKGVNVSLALHAAGVETMAVVPVGGIYGRELIARLREFGCPVRAIHTDGRTRSNLTLVEADGTTTKLNEPGPHLLREEREELFHAACELGAAGDWLTICGSLPAGVGADDVVGAIRTAQTAGMRVAVDSSGPALESIIVGSNGVVADLIKPNAHELASALGIALRTLGDVVDAARRVHTRTGTVVLVSLGVDGAVLVNDHGEWHGVASATRVVNTAGAGDAFLAGYLAASVAGLEDPDCMKHALRWGSGAVETAGTVFTRGAVVDSGEATVIPFETSRGRAELREPAFGPRDLPLVQPIERN